MTNRFRRNDPILTHVNAELAHVRGARTCGDGDDSVHDLAASAHLGRVPSFEPRVLGDETQEDDLVEAPPPELFGVSRTGMQARNGALDPTRIMGSQPTRGGVGSPMDDVVLPEGTRLPFWTSSYDASSELVTEVFNDDDGVWPRPSDEGFIRKTNWPVPSVLFECHSQGMAVGAGRALMSCMQQRPDGRGEREGWILVLDIDTETMWLKSVGDRAHPHPAIGQGVLGGAVKDRLGSLYPAEITMLVPCVNSKSGSGNQGCSSVPNVDLYDQNGDWIFGFCHEPFAGASGRDAEDLAACALLARAGKLYLLAVRHEHLYIYRIYWFGPARRSAHIDARLLVVQNVDELQRRDGGAGSAGWRHAYNSINLFRNKQGQLFMMCGRQGQCVANRWILERKPQLASELESAALGTQTDLSQSCKRRTQERPVSDW